jgi:hypothetical protein
MYLADKVKFSDIKGELPKFSKVNFLREISSSWTSVFVTKKEEF